MTTSTRHVRMVLHNITLMSEEIDRNGKKLRLLDSELTRCQDENVRNSSTITHLYRLVGYFLLMPLLCFRCCCCFCCCCCCFYCCCCCCCCFILTILIPLRPIDRVNQLGKISLLVKVLENPISLWTTLGKSIPQL